MAFTWLSPVNWLRARRHVLAHLYDTTNAKRKLWADLQAQHDSTGEFRLQRDLPESFSFVVLGDTGEGDASQLVLVDRFLEEAADCAFSIIASDVIYPAGRSADYREKFYIPYRHHEQDLYVIPGNHDWYDELHGFMAHFCDNRRRLRDPSLPTIGDDKLMALRQIRTNQVFQPNMYFFIDHPLVRIVCVDTGIKAVIDDDQEAWLRRVSADPRPKILLTGNPIYVNGGRKRSLDGVLSIVEQHNYVLVVGGDTHNFQRYRIPVGTGASSRIVWHVVNGGGGAYLRRTDTIPPAAEMELGPFSLEEGTDFACYPTREQSRRALKGRWARLLPSWAADKNAPPYYKSFVKVAVGPEGLRVRAFGVEDFAKGLAATEVIWDETIELAPTPSG
jgi:hypothetical protein